MGSGEDFFPYAPDESVSALSLAAGELAQAAAEAIHAATFLRQRSGMTRAPKEAADRAVEHAHHVQDPLALGYTHEDWMITVLRSLAAVTDAVVVCERGWDGHRDSNGELPDRYLAADKAAKGMEALAGTCIQAISEMAPAGVDYDLDNYMGDHRSG